MNKKNKNKDLENMELEIGEDTTKYGEFVSSYFAWVSLPKQKEKVEKKYHVLHQCQAGLQSRKEKLFHNRLCIQSYISIL